MNFFRKKQIFYFNEIKRKNVFLRIFLLTINLFLLRLLLKKLISSINSQVTLQTIFEAKYLNMLKSANKAYNERLPMNSSKIL